MASLVGAKNVSVRSGESMASRRRGRSSSADARVENSGREVTTSRMVSHSVASSPASPDAGAARAPPRGAAPRPRPGAADGRTRLTRAHDGRRARGAAAPAAGRIGRSSTRRPRRGRRGEGGARARVRPSRTTRARERGRDESCAGSPRGRREGVGVHDRVRCAMGSDARATRSEPRVRRAERSRPSRTRPRSGVDVSEEARLTTLLASLHLRRRNV